MSARVRSRPFGRLPDGTEAMLFALSGAAGLRVDVTPFGATVVSIYAPDRAGHSDDIVLGFSSVEGYAQDRAYVGGTVGRYANRIAGASFTLDGRRFELAANDGRHHLHGGRAGFNKVPWTAEPSEDGGSARLRLFRLSPDGEEGYPGRLEVSVTYSVTDANQLVIEYAATTDAPTPICLTHHSYFNLGGHDSGDIQGHRLWIDADRYLPVAPALIPTGERAPVAGTPLDFRGGADVGLRIEDPHPQMRLAKGYDHCYVLNGRNPGSSDPVARPNARLFHPASGRTLEVATTEPGLQFFSGNLSVAVPGKAGRPYPFRAGLCLEPEHFPDSPNQPSFPSVILRPGERYASTTIYSFGQRS
jgi:aldose 1-epimerase